MSDFRTQWNAQTRSIEAGWLRARRSNRVSLIPELSGPGKLPRQIYLKFDTAFDLDDAVKLTLTARDNRDFKPDLVVDGSQTLAEPDLAIVKPEAVYFAGLRLLPREAGHSATLSHSVGGVDMTYTITLALASVSLSPVLSESTLLRAAQRNMTAAEATDASSSFSAHCGPGDIVVADDQSHATLEIRCEGAQPGRDTVWIATLSVMDRFLSDAVRQGSVLVNHTPFAVAQILPPGIGAEAGSILAQWRSDDPAGAQWRFGVETVSLHFPPQAIGEAMVRGSRFRPPGAGSPVGAERPVGYRFSRRTELTVRPSRQDRRYTVHPGDMLSVLRDAELEQLVTELAYPLELTYVRTPDLQRTVTVSEVGQALGQPAVLLPYTQPETAFSELLALYYTTHGVPLESIVGAQRKRHVAACASYRHRLAQFALADANYPMKPLNLREGLSARLRSAVEGAPAIYPLPDGVQPDPVLLAGTEAFMAGDPAKATLPAGLLYTVEFAAELGAILRTPVTRDVQLMALNLSILGANGTMQAAFDEGRTVFDVQVENGQLSRVVKTRYGRIAVAWNKARQIVVYARSTAPGAQFQAEQKDEWFPGRPMLRKMEEYIEILEPQRRFDSEANAVQNRAGCLHAFYFATRTIYVNSAWGRDIAAGYEIPLYNEIDTSGFYIKPWMGPVARGGGDDLVQHWHKRPQHLYFYTNTVPGKGADSDLWDAVPGLDLDDKCGLGAIAALRVPGGELIDQRWVPSYTLEAAGNPRFAMAVEAEGLSNLMHGRGAEELVASVRTMQVERTAATSRVDFGAGSVFAAVQGFSAPAEALWQAAKASAELKSIDAVIASVLDDAGALWKTFGAASACDKLQGALHARVKHAFEEARGRLVNAYKVLPQQSTELTEHVLAGLNLEQRLPDSIIDTACAEGARAIGDMRGWLASLPGAADVAQRWNRIEETWMAAPVRALLSRAAAALKGPVAVLEGVDAALDRLATAFKVQQQQFMANVDTCRNDIAAVLADPRDQEFKQKVQAALDVTTKMVVEGEADLERLRVQLEGMKLPERVEGLRQLRQRASALLLQQTRLLAATRVLVEAASAEVAALVAGEAAEIAECLRTLAAVVLDPLPAAVVGMGTAIQEWLAGPRKSIRALCTEVNAQRNLLENGELSADIGALFARERDAFAALKKAVADAAADITAEVNAFDAALSVLYALVATPGRDVRAKLATMASAQLDAYAGMLQGQVAQVATAMNAIGAQVGAALDTAQLGVIAELTEREAGLHRLIDQFDCGAWDKFSAGIEDQVRGVVADLRTQVLEQAAQLFDQETIAQATAVREVVAGIIETAKGGTNELLKKACIAIAPQAGQAIKLARLLTDPPQLPQLTIRTNRLDCVYDDLEDQIQTSPFVARVREFDVGLKELGLALPSRELCNHIVPDALQGMQFSSIIRNAALDFENFFRRFRLPAMPDGAIRVTHHIDPQNRSANVKAEINHQFSSTESLFDTSVLSLDIRRPKLVATTNFDVGATEAAKPTSQAQFSGDWILNFAGQPLVTFVGASIQYSDSGGFKFDLDPKKIEPHAALKFIGDVIRAQMPELPDNVEIIKNSAGMPVGASIVQNQSFGPLELGGVSIGETVLASGFGVRVVDGNMKVDTSFSIGTQAAPVFLQIGLYGGGGWLTARAWLDDTSGAMKPRYEASIGVSLGSAKSFTLAGVATGTYALRLFIEAAFSTGANSFVAGLQLTGSARILGYLNAYLNLLVQVEHNGGTMSGRGQLDVSIKVCWCYTARISRTVQQNM